MTGDAVELKKNCVLRCKILQSFSLICNLTFHCSLMYTWFFVMRRIPGLNANTGNTGTVSSQILNNVHLILVS